jgi:hypothetical protein
MIIYCSKYPTFIHDNTLKFLNTKMFENFSGLDKEITRWEEITAKKKPEAKLAMVFHSASNVSCKGEPCFVYGDNSKLILFARFTFVDISEEPIYLIDETVNITMNEEKYVKYITYLSTDTSIKKIFWVKNFDIIQDQKLIEELEWYKIT